MELLTISCGWNNNDGNWRNLLLFLSDYVIKHDNMKMTNNWKLSRTKNDAKDIIIKGI